jgi:methionyl-tRNA formyltransferase
VKIAYFGLPLGALLLADDGHTLDPIVLAPVEAPGRRRLRRRSPGLLDALDGGAGFSDRVDAALREPVDLLVSWFWTRKLPGRWLERPRLGAIGVHPSLLPRHRGPNPYFWTIDSGDALAGVTVHRLEREYDTGALLAARSLEVGDRDAWQLARALDRPSLSLLRDTVARLARGEPVQERPQSEAEVTMAPEPDGDDLHVDFGWTTERVLRRIRALSPTPGLALELASVPLFVTRAEPAQAFVSALLPGEAHLSDSLTLRTSDGAIRVTRAVFPGDQDEAADAPTEPCDEESLVAKLRPLMKNEGRA